MESNCPYHILSANTLLNMSFVLPSKCGRFCNESGSGKLKSVGGTPPIHRPKLDIGDRNLCKVIDGEVGGA